MRELHNSISTDEFRQLNEVAGQLGMLDDWSIGMIRRLIESQVFSSKQEWRSFYEYSGLERHKLLEKSNIHSANYELLNGHEINKHKLKIYGLDFKVKRLNMEFGRTHTDLESKARFLAQRIPNMTLTKAITFLHHKIFDEYYDELENVYQEALEVLKRLYPNLSFLKIEAQKANYYAVNYECKKEANVVGGVLLKTQMYMINSLQMDNVRLQDRAKHERYEKERRRKVQLLIFDKESKSFDEHSLEWLQNQEIFED